MEFPAETSHAPRPQAPDKLLLAEVVFPIPLRRGFDYIVPPALRAPLRPGHRVTAPFGKQGLQTGVVVRLHEGTGEPSLLQFKSIETLPDPDPALDERGLSLARWMADRYYSSLGEAVFCMLPMGQRRPPRRAGPVLADAVPAAASVAPVLTEDQRAACAAILPAIQERRFEGFLLLGVAAAGKTEVYLQAVDAALRLGRSALYLVPEIGLTPQTGFLLKARFGKTVDVWHSEVAPGEKWRIWRRMRSGECRVLLGARSAVFAPLRDLGLIVVDEEHDRSYKEDGAPRYHARDVALERGRLQGAAVILGSATPSMESYHRAGQGGLRLLEMPRRVEDRPFPQIHVVDMRRDWYNVLSGPLVDAAGLCLERGEQCLLFLNRRGFFTYVTCRRCGWEARCAVCGVSLVYHAAAGADELRCHSCGHKEAPPAACPKCGGPAVKMKGKGTQRVESQIGMLFPKARVLRWDRDTTRRRHAHAEAFEAARSAEVDVVVGTQMIAQGLDFPRVTVVGILDGDHALRFPDFRAGERTFQLLTQVAGRARRGDGRAGDVYLQTRDPDHYAVRAAARFDYKTFAREELAFRREMGYPPFVRLAHVLVRGRAAEKVERAAEEFLRALEEGPLPEGVQCLGPAPSFRRRGGVVQWQLIVKGPEGRMEEALRRAVEHKWPSGVSAAVDVDPEDME